MKKSPHRDFRSLFLISVFLLLAACAPSREKQATDIYDAAIEAFCQKKIGTAKLLIDSIQRYYVDVPNVYRDAKDLRKIVVKYERGRSVTYLDSMLAECEAKQKPLLKKMAIDDKYADIPVFVAQTQQTSRAFSRCYVRAMADAHGDFTISSNWVGPKAIHHNKVSISCNDQFFVSEQVEDEARNFSFSDGENIWEIVKYQGNDAADIAKFIYANVDNRVAVDFQGPKAHYTSVMTDVDKEAVANVWELSILLRESRTLKSQLRSIRQQMTHDE